MEKGELFNNKHLIETIIEKDIKQYGISKETTGCLDYDLVECSDDEEDEIISNILFQNALLKYTGEIYDLPSLIKDIEKVENGFEFRRLQLSDDEYKCLNEIISELKRHITA